MDYDAVYDLYQRGHSVKFIVNHVFEHQDIYFNCAFLGTNFSRRDQKYTKAECENYVRKILISKI